MKAKKPVGRPPGREHDKTFTLRLAAASLARVDQQRNATSRSEWIRQAIEDRLNAVKAQEAQIGKG